MNWFEYSRMLLDKCKKNEIPYHVGFELTPLCNFRCNMCYIRLDPEQVTSQGQMLSTEQWLYLAKEARKLGTVSMEMTGGEAMTRPDFSFLYESFIKLGFLIVLRTNGYLIDEQKLALFRSYKPRKLYITLYGASDKTYQKVCGVSDGFSVVSKNIISLCNAGIDVHLTATITKENVEDIEQMQKWVKEQGLSLSLAGMLFTPIRGAKRSVDHLKVRVADEEYELTEEMKSLSHEISNRDYYMNPFWMCRAYGAKFAITWDGKMTMCYSNPSIWKDPFIKGLEEAYHELYRDLRKIRRPKECETCKYLDLCSVCPSMLYSATGNMECTNDEMCRIARRVFKNMIMRSNDLSNNITNIPDNVCEEKED